jgi:hypothetical protein
MKKNPDDTELLNWLADRCYYPSDRICVLVPEEISANGSFTLNQEHDRKALRLAIQYQDTKDRTR